MSKREKVPRMQAIEQLERASRSNGIERSECTETAGATCSVATDLTSLATAGAGAGAEGAADAGVIASVVEAAAAGAASGAGTLAAGAAACCSDVAAAGAASPDGVAVAGAVAVPVAAIAFAAVDAEATPRQNTCTAPPCVPTNSVACRWCASTTNVCANESVRTSSNDGAPGCKHSYSCTVLVAYTMTACKLIVQSRRVLHLRDA